MAMSDNTEKLQALLEAIQALPEAVTKEEIQAIVNEALEEAKASGEFDGEDGVSPTIEVSKSGKVTTLTITDAEGSKVATINDGQDGEDGVSPTVEVSKTGKVTTLTITDVNGEHPAVIIDGADGQDGEDGYTPVKGVDYYNDDDKAEFTTYIAQELAKRGQLKPEFSASIEDCTDTSKLYVLPDGFIYAYMPSDAPSYTNLAGTITYDRRLSSSGKASSSALTGAAYTDFIPVKQGQTVRIKGFNIYTPFSSSSWPYVCFYTGASESNVVSDTTYFRPGERTNEFAGVADSVNGSVVTWKAFRSTLGNQHPLASAITHIRISGWYFEDQEIIVTVDEEITENATVGNAWQSTGHAFVPADYEAEIEELRETKIEKSDIPTALPNPHPLTINGSTYDGSEAVDVDIVSSGNVLHGKKWVACGDSFTCNGYKNPGSTDQSEYIYQDGKFAGQFIVYPYIIGLRNNMDIVMNATSGQTMTPSDNSFMDKYMNIPADADYITIALGINDKLQGAVIGTLEDTTTDTFCGCYNIAMEHIITTHPYAHIGIMVYHGTNAEIMEATRGIAERWGVPYLDYGSPQVPLMNRYTGRNVCEKAQLIRETHFCVDYDGVTMVNAHPNTAAHRYESTFIEAWLRTL